jgi:dehydrogenase/reductase SDR family protein 4
MVKQGGGSIVLIGSTAGQTPSPDLMAYEIAKAGVAHMARCLADELACDRITVNCVAPGLIRSHSSSYLWGNESLLQSMAVGFSYLSQALVPR